MATTLASAAPARLAQPRFSLSHLLALLLFWAMTSVTVYPLIWLILNSLKTSNEMFDATWLPPETWQWGNYVAAWDFGIQQYLLNSLIVTLASVAATVLLAALAAYALVVMDFRGKALIYITILGGAILPPEVSLFPLFKILTGLGIYNTRLALILPYIAFGLPFTTFLHLTIHGGGELLEELRRLAVQLGLNGRVDFSTVLLPIEQLPGLITTADLALVPYRRDSFTDAILPTKLMEYAALGMPVVAARTSAIAAHFDETMVEFFRPESVDDMASAILRLYRDENRRLELATNIGRFSRHNPWRVEAAAYVDLVARLATR